MIAVADVARATEPTDRLTRRLIQQLGSPQYAIRKSAEDELQRMGRSAIDQLLEAQYDENSEIRLAVRELLARLPMRGVRISPTS